MHFHKAKMEEGAAQAFWSRVVQLNNPARPRGSRAALQQARCGEKGSPSRLEAGAEDLEPRVLFFVLPPGPCVRLKSKSCGCRWVGGEMGLDVRV